MTVSAFGPLAPTGSPPSRKGIFSMPPPPSVMTHLDSRPGGRVGRGQKGKGHLGRDVEYRTFEAMPFRDLLLDDCLQKQNGVVDDVLHRDAEDACR